ncbi:hypothetical protein [Hymenobacter guriensis]|uniref:YD repeat-containing protein n=1 Tax=Hymenobacter guriensis TaxID=2793065 RepID=A0ABS0L7N8_9BACT|nr:hypothetical protein [Hymenobacter guriensis]MBG8556145.1 hypothetical protein [Hymenobacter guriensis]
MHKNTILLLLLLFVLFGQLNAQIPQSVPPVQSPTVASLGLFGDVPVSPFTGLPSISVPLYTIQEGNLTVPIVLSYHASGFRPDMHPGWVGMGWSLEAGGTITRIVHDRIDEYALPKDPTNPANLGFYFQHSILNNSTWEQGSFIENTLIKGSYSAANDKNHIKDTEPDEFSFSCPGYTGQFYLNHEGKWQVKCDRPVKVEVITTPKMLISSPFASLDSTENPYLKSFIGFVLTGDDGTQYQFGGTRDAIEYSTDFFLQGYGQSNMTANAWQLTKITDTNGNTINFTYQREAGNGRFINQMYYSVYQDIETKVAQAGSGVADFFFITKSNCAGFENTSQNNDVIAFQSGQLISPVYLTSISCTSSTVTFTSSLTRELRYDNYRAYSERKRIFDLYRPHELFLPMLEISSNALDRYPTSLQKLQWKKLDNISVNYQGKFLKSFQLEYSDRPGNEVNAEKQRLTLEALRENGYTPQSGSVTKPPYLFEYNSQRFTGYITDYLANSNDHWGFFNGVYASIDHTQGSGYLTTYQQQRDATNSLAFATLGMLTRVTYPTGGSTVFEYEQPSYSKCLYEDRSLAPEVLTTARTAGGVRIKKIKNYVSRWGEATQEKEYFYVTGYKNSINSTALPSSGVLGGMSRYYYDDYRNFIIGYSTSTNPAIYSKRIFSSQPVIPASSNKGTHVGYSEIVEKRSDGGYTKYTYSNFDTGAAYRDEVAAASSTLMPQRTLYQPFASNEEMRGKLLKEELFTAQDVRVKAREIEYTALNKQTDYVRSVQADAFTACPSTTTDGVQEGTAYRLYTYSYLPSRETETLYDIYGKSPVTTVKNIQYNLSGYRLKISESVTDSKNQTQSTTYRYPFDLTFPSGVTPPTQPLTDPVASTIRAMTAKNIVGTPIETINVRNNQIIGVSVQTYRLGGLNNSCILPFQAFRLETDQPLSAYTPTTYGTTTSSPLIIGGGSTQMQLKSTCTLYDAKGNLVGLSYEGGQQTSYLWGYNATLPIAKTENAAPNETFHCNFEGTKVADKWDGAPLRYESTPSDGSMARNTARTGLLAGALYTTTPQQHEYAFGPSLTIASRPRKFVVSGWVYSAGPAAQLLLLLNKPSAQRADGTVNYYEGMTAYNLPVYLLETNETAKWVYLEKEVDIPDGVTLLTLRLDNHYNGASVQGGGVWFDDVRVHPADAQMITYTHRPGVGVTSMSDTNNKPVFYEYDGLNRFSVVKDQEGNILKTLEYNYHQ